MIFRRWTRVRANAKAFFANIVIGIGAYHVHDEQILAPVFVIDIGKLFAQEEAIQMVDSGNIARPNAKQGAVGPVISRLDLNLTVAFLDFQHAFHMREDIPFGRVIRMRKVYL